MGAAQNRGCLAFPSDSTQRFGIRSCALQVKWDGVGATVWGYWESVSVLEKNVPRIIFFARNRLNDDYYAFLLI